MTTSVMRVPAEVHAEAKRIAALRGRATGDVIAEAWREYLENHKERFAAELEDAAKVMRDGTLDELVALANRDNDAIAEAAAEAAAEPTTEPQSR